ncbi:MAG: lactate utilization protein [Candidatus Hodarchaeota archaeon]
MKTKIEATISAFQKRHFNAFFAETVDAANKLILRMIPAESVVGIGDSTTTRQMGVIDELRKRGTTVIDGFDHRSIYATAEDWEEHRRLAKAAVTSDVFLTGTNAVTQDGRLVNVDAVGGRVAGMFWGHPTSIIVVGKNKIVKNLNEAFHRIRNVTAPNHMRIKAVELGGRRYDTPCVVTGKCTDCRSSDRACNVFSIIEGKPWRTTINVILVNEDLGLGWDESWPPERIAKIKEGYKRFVWCPPPRPSTQ